MSSEIIYLNVGGIKYSTTRSTLCKYPESMLGAMFAHNMPSQVDKDGCYFIDRNGKMFEYILQFLRSGEMALPNDFKEYNLLKSEIDFYQLEPLLDGTTFEKKLQLELIVVAYCWQSPGASYLDNSGVKVCKKVNSDSFEVLYTEEKRISMADSRSSLYEFQKISNHYINIGWTIKDTIEVSSFDQFSSFLLSTAFDPTSCKSLRRIYGEDKLRSSQVKIFYFIKNC